MAYSDVTPRRPAAASAFLSLPILLGLGMMIAGGLLFFAIQVGFDPEGGVIRYTWRSQCDAQAKVALAARLQDLGLPHTAYGAGLDFQVTLPGKFEDEMDHIGRLLTRPGTFAVYADGKLLTDRFKDAAFQLSLTNGVAVSLVTLDIEPPADRTEVWIDNERVPVNAITGGELQVATDETRPELAIREATDRVVVIRHPLPCSVQLVSAARVTEEQNKLDGKL
jgi:hypothetical protein